MAESPYPLLNRDGSDMDGRQYAALLRAATVDLTDTASSPTDLGLTLRGATEACIE